jgi:two-component system, NarL family, sensor kinase
LTEAHALAPVGASRKARDIDRGWAAAVAAYRIACEAVLNTARHAHASECVVRLAASDTALTLSAADNGTGFGDARPGVGLLALRERAEELGGTIDIVSVPGAGTSIRAELPIAQVTGADR